MTPSPPKRISLAQAPTPIEFLPELTRMIGGPEIWVKRDDLTGSVLNGNKIRKLEYALGEAVRQKADVVITAGGIQSNHCRSTALACARLQLKCHLILRGSQDGAPDGNLLLDHLAGAEISYFPDEEYSTRQPAIVDELVDKYRKQGKRCYWIPVGASNAIGSLGYVRAWQEIRNQSKRMNLTFDHVISAVGSGGTTAGLIAGRALDNVKTPRIWGVNVCDDAEYFQKEIRVILDELKYRFNLALTKPTTPIHILDGHVGPGYARPYKDMIETIKTCGELEGLILDPVYTGKAFHGMLQEIKAGRFRKKDRILFIHTGGMFGLFPQKDVFGFKPAPKKRGQTTSTPRSKN